MPDVHFDRVEARVAQHRRAVRVLLDDRGDVVGVTACVRRIPSGLNTRDGATAGDFVPIGFATGPAWPICAATAAPSACTASVSSRRPAPTSGLSSTI